MRQPQHPQIRKLLELVNPRVGVIRELTLVSRGVDEPSPPILYRALLSNFDFKKVDPQERAAAGKGATGEEAMGGAIGEAVERYCAYHPSLGSIRRARVDELDAPVITPNECVLYSAGQYAKIAFPYPPWSDDRPIGWLEARELPGDRKVYVPAWLVYLNYYGPESEDSYCAATTNGLAAGADLESAVLAGLCEVVERDGFLVHWMNRLPAAEVEFEGGIAGDVRAHYRRFGVETRVFDVSTDMPAHVMMAVSLCEDPRAPSALFGLGCSLDPRVAVNRAMFEICQVRPGECAKFLKEDVGALLREYGDVRTLRDHSAFLMPHDRRREIAFLLEGGRRRALAEMTDFSTGGARGDLDILANALAASGYRVAYADLTTSDVEPFGIRVVRAIAAGLQPIHFGYGEERLGGKRLFELPRALGYGDAVRTEASLNPCPHPLA